MVSIAAFQAVDPGSIPGRRNFFFFRPFMNTIHSRYDEVAEWLRRWTANPMGSARVGSNPILVVNFLEQMIQIASKSFPLPGIEPGPPG